MTGPVQSVIPTISYRTPTPDDNPPDRNRLAKTVGCEHCGGVREICFQCEQPIALPYTFSLYPGYGNQDSRCNVRLCELCHGKLARLVYSWLSVRSPYDEHGRWIS